MPASQTNSRIYSLTLLTVAFLSNQISCGAHQISVCTYNLWNVMFSWEIRLRHIASMVSQAGCDVLLLQEVRLHGDRSGSQALFLQRLMPHFHWLAARLADQAEKPPDSYWTGWEGEGLAVLSKLPMGKVWVEHLSRSHGPDTNHRIALHAPIIIDSQTTVNIIVVHFSYHRQQQCQNTAEILKFIHRNDLSNAVIAGDFNAYPDFPDPVQLFMDQAGQPASEANKCRKNPMSPLTFAAQGFKDAWEATHDYASGFTFSNMPTPGLTSRPDRILVSNNLTVVQTSLHGDGMVYKSRHSTDIILHRLHRVLRAAKDSFSGHAGYPCLQDCGPRGSCRCGVCVEGKELGSCQLPDCEECSSDVFMLVLAFSSILCLLFILVGIAAVKILVVASRMDQSSAFFMLGCTCCLCNPRLVRQSTTTARHCAGRFLRCLGVGKLPPVYLLLLSLIATTLFSSVGFVVFKPTLDTVAAVMSEEYFPSDHLMLLAKLEIF